MTLEEIKLATQNFSDKNLIGVGGFGKVFKGLVTRGIESTTVVVVKRFDKIQRQGQVPFLKELIILFDYRHENIVGLEGYCNENDEKIIVYEYASRQSLDRYLSDTSLTWTKRLKICVDIVRGLAFLHGGGPTKDVVVHRDIKSANVLVYGDWKAKITDLGLSTITSVGVVDHSAGTIGYLDPLYLKTGFLNEKSDIYSLGVVLFEILYGQLLVSRMKYGIQHVTRILEQIHEEGKTESIVFKPIRNQIVPKSLSTFRAIASQCLVHDGEERPTAEEVLQQLEKSLELQEDYEIWEPKLPEDYEEILKLSTYSGTYSTEMKKNLYNLLIKGIFLQDDKLLFTLGSNGERSEIISARTFSYRNGNPHDNWCINVPKSRFSLISIYVLALIYGTLR
ncbi:receptor-like protein kinase FERONIA [Bidens hawaiensis]|uniref:receptor-like protein kinase FERONIA n=1 Tax=Bidens hawaiensis TaxID=980011 RepID=UPI00404B8A94